MVPKTKVRTFVKIAVLVLAHKNMAQISALVELLKEEFDVYVHLDAKSKLEPRELLTSQNIFVLKKHRIRWGSPAIVKASLSLLKYAASANYDRYILVSGQDLPIKPLKDIRKFFEINPEKEFVGSLNLRDWDHGGLTRVTRYHSPSHLGSKGAVKTWLRFQSYALDRIQDFLNIKRTLEIEFYCGPQWVDLTGKAVKAILEYVEANTWLLRRFRWTACSDEIFFPTILNLLNMESRLENQVLRYVDWSEAKDSPKLLGSDDLVGLRNSKALFARKFEFSTETEMREFRDRLKEKT